MNKGKRFLSELKLYSDYLKWNENEQRYETWQEAVNSVFNTHYLKYGESVLPLLELPKKHYLQKNFLVAQRLLQFREDLMLRNNCRMYNCSVAYCYSPDIFKKGFFMLLSGCGFGVNIQYKYINQMPIISSRGAETVTFQIPDSIEGWSIAANVLISSFCKHPSLDESLFGKRINFDYSLIREEGSYISGGFKAPGHKGLQNCLEKIEDFLLKQLGNSESICFRPYIVYNIFMHISNAVLSGGIRRSAMNFIMDRKDDEMIYAKTGNWRSENPHFARSNNSVGLLKNMFSKEEFKKLLDLNEGDNDCGFVLLESEDQLFNPCFEVGFDFYNQITDFNDTVIQMCNLVEINAEAALDKNNKLDEDLFYEICEAASIEATLQAGYTHFPFLGEQTEKIVSGEALIGVGITGWFNNPALFNAEILKKASNIVVSTNVRVATDLGLNPSARCCVVKPSGNASVILGTGSGIHAEHSKSYFRIMQLNKESETAKWLEENMPYILEESQWSENKTDYVVYIPIENNPNGLFKKDITDIKHLELIALVQENWVANSNNSQTAYNKDIHHNVSNTVLIDNKEQVIDYIYDNQQYFVAVSFLDRSGDKDYIQAPFTEVLDMNQIVEIYGEAALFASGLIVDGLHYFNDNLWDACTLLEKPELQVIGNKEQVLLRKYWLKRAKKFAKNYFKGDIKKTIYCLKDIHLFHKWKSINREFKEVDFTKILKKPEFKNVDTLGAISCQGGTCEIVRI
jgi:hypothetical protein